MMATGAVPPGIDLRRHGGALAHVPCADGFELERLLAAGGRAVNSPDALADPAEVMPS